MRSSVHSNEQAAVVRRLKLDDADLSQIEAAFIYAQLEVS